MRESGRDEGRIGGEQRLLLRLGTKRFGEPDAAIEAIKDLDRLEVLSERMLDWRIQNWNDLLRTP